MQDKMRWLWDALKQQIGATAAPMVAYPRCRPSAGGGQTDGLALQHSRPLWDRVKSEGIYELLNNHGAAALSHTC